MRHWKGGVARATSIREQRRYVVCIGVLFVFYIVFQMYFSFFVFVCLCAAVYGVIKNNNNNNRPPL